MLQNIFWFNLMWKIVFQQGRQISFKPIRLIRQISKYKNVSFSENLKFLLKWIEWNCSKLILMISKINTHNNIKDTIMKYWNQKLDGTILSRFFLLQNIWKKKVSNRWEHFFIILWNNLFLFCNQERGYTVAV